MCTCAAWTLTHTSPTPFCRERWRPPVRRSAMPRSRVHSSTRRFVHPPPRPPRSTPPPPHSSSRMTRADLESCLLVLSFEATCSLLKYLLFMLRRDESVEVCARTIVFILRLHEVRPPEGRRRWTVSERTLTPDDTPPVEAAGDDAVDDVDAVDPANVHEEAVDEEQGEASTTVRRWPPHPPQWCTRVVTVRHQSLT